MNRQEYIFQPIGIIHTPHKDPSQTPIQPVFSKGIRGTAELFSEYVDGLKDLDGFSHIYLLYYFDRSTQVKMKVRPYIKRFDSRGDVRSGWQDDIPDDIAFPRGRRDK